MCHISKLNYGTELSEIELGSEGDTLRFRFNNGKFDYIDVTLGDGCLEIRGMSNTTGALTIEPVLGNSIKVFLEKR